jgi:hypothetical protein
LKQQSGHFASRGHRGGTEFRFPRAGREGEALLRSLDPLALLSRDNLGGNGGDNQNLKWPAGSDLMIG